MIWTLKRKFIKAAMTAVTVLLLSLLGALNLVNAWSTRQESLRLLDNLIQIETQDTTGHPDGQNRPVPSDGEWLPMQSEGEWPFRGEGERERGFMMGQLTENDRMSAVFFTVRLRDGTATKTDVSRISTVSQEAAEAMAAAAASAGETEGSVENYYFTSAQAASGETVYVFLEISNRRNAVLRVAALSALAGLGGWLLMLGLVVLLAKRTIAPVAENMDRQRQFVTDAGHELKTPLSIIQANTEAMELIQGENNWSRNIKAQVVRLTELTRNLLTLARAEEVPSQGSFAPVDISALTAKTAQMFQTPMEQKGLTLKAEADSGVMVRGQEAQLSNLCSILFDNAVKYASADSALHLRLRAGEKTCTLRLENRCDKLPDCPPERLFDRFYRADAARTQSSGGFGIGLSAAQVIVLQHRGRLEAEYPAEARIAFTVILPLDK